MTLSPDTPPKPYTWHIIKNLQDGEMFHMKQCKIPWVEFVELAKILQDKRVLWPGDISFNESITVLKRIG